MYLIYIDDVNLFNILFKIQVLFLKLFIGSNKKFEDRKAQ